MARLLAPAAVAWGWIARRRLARSSPYRSSLPVVCVGNFTAGGTGKTPLSIHIAGLLAALGERPAFLTRGYGGRHAGPRRVDPAIDTSTDVGDEALLLARHAPVMVARDRAQGARYLEADAGLAPPTVIVMDDGLQNPGLAKDLSIAVVDGRRGFGNGKVMPAGPLRAPLELQLALADAILVNRAVAGGDGASAVAESLRQRFIGPVLEATVEADDAAAATFTGQRVLALAGIAHPQRFLDLLRIHGAEIADSVIFPDHHAFAERDAEFVLARASTLGVPILTTEKDWVRLVGRGGALARLREAARPLAIRLRLEPRDASRLSSLLATMLAEPGKGGPVSARARAP